MIQRIQYKAVMGRLKSPRKFIQVIMGPRQVGKTTLTLQVMKAMDIPGTFVAADAVQGSGEVWINTQWEAARLKCKNEGATEFLLIIDEIQKIENWSEIIKKNWDSDTLKDIPIKLILLGSSRLLLQQGLEDTFSGKSASSYYEITYLPHWSFREMEEAFGWNANQFAWFGGYPGAASLIEDEDRWRNYITDSLIESSISREIYMRTRVDKPALMRRLFEIGCLYSGQVISFNKMLGQLFDAGNTTTLAHYLKLLNSAGLLGGVSKYSPQEIHKRSSSPKFQVHNNALLSAIRNESFAEILLKREDWGRIVESAVGAHLLNYSLTEKFNLFYWKDRNSEVDFVIEKRGKVIGLEVKSGQTGRLSGLEAFSRQFQPDKVLVVGSGGIPWEEFLKINPGELF